MHRLDCTSHFHARAKAKVFRRIAAALCRSITPLRSPGFCVNRRPKARLALAQRTVAVCGFVRLLRSLAAPDITCQIAHVILRRNPAGIGLLLDDTIGETRLKRCGDIRRPNRRVEPNEIHIPVKRHRQVEFVLPQRERTRHAQVGDLAVPRAFWCAGVADKFVNDRTEEQVGTRPVRTMAHIEVVVLPCLVHIHWPRIAEEKHVAWRQFVSRLSHFAILSLFPTRAVNERLAQEKSQIVRRMRADRRLIQVVL